MLAVACSPRGFQQLDVKLERAKLEKALCPMIREGQTRLEWLETATFGELDRRISAPDELHVIHFIGHGAYDERTSGGILIFEDENGAAREVTGEELGACVGDERSLRLVVLNSCEGSRSSHVDPFSGVAQSLLGAGMPAVVGMQAEITDRAAVMFADRLYTALAQGYPIDGALANARRAIFTSERNVEFGTPVLFMNVPDGQDLRALVRQEADAGRAARAEPAPGAGERALGRHRELAPEGPERGLRGVVRPDSARQQGEDAPRAGRPAGGRRDRGDLEHDRQRQRR